jgi:SAM-dependent methyltransferase
MNNINTITEAPNTTETAIGFIPCYAPVPSSVKHPATYTESFIPKFAELLSECTNVLDPFGGVGKLALIKDYGFKGKVVCNELEREWAEIGKYNVDEWSIGDAANLRFANCEFDAICTSPTYGNRMADHHNAKDASKRITYRHCLGRPLNEENTGKMQWGEKYRQKHIEIYRECLRVLKPNGLMIVNVSDHIRKGQVMNVVEWHKQTLLDIGMKLIDEIKIETPRMGFGQNAKSRVQHECILVFRHGA